MQPITEFEWSKAVEEALDLPRNQQHFALVTNEFGASKER